MNLIESLDQALVNENEPYRAHLGFSQIGNEDERKLWLQFRWCFPAGLPGRVLRLFDLGNRIEDQIAENLGKVEGIEIHATDKKGKPFARSTLGGHFAGSIDGIVRGVMADRPDQRMILEVKSANDKRFKDLVSRGTYRSWSKEYSVQIDCYMSMFKTPYTLVVVCNKNTSDIYTEIIEEQPEVFDEMKTKAEYLLNSERPPDLLYPPTDHRIKSFMTPHQQRVYLGKELPPDINCRNCRFSKVVVEGEDAPWVCTRTNKPLSVEQQRKGGKKHQWIPHLVPLQVVKVEEDQVTYKKGKQILVNTDEEGSHQVGNHYSSADFLELSKAEFDEGLIKNLKSIRDQVDGSVTKVQSNKV
jgi:hypothetical protein